MGNLIMVKKNEKYGIIDTLKNILIPTDYDRLDYEGKGLFKAKKGDKFGLINLKNEQLTPFQYDEILSLNKGFIKVKKQGYFGFINEKGQEVIPCIYNKTESQFTNRLMKVTRDEKTFYIDDKGTEYFIEE